MMDEYNNQDEGTYYFTEEEMREREEKARAYNRGYLDELGRRRALYTDDEWKDIVEVHNKFFNVRHSDSGQDDAARNVLEAAQAVTISEKAVDPATQSYMNYLDKRSGKPGTGRLKLKQAYKDTEGSSYFDPETNPALKTRR